MYSHLRDTTLGPLQDPAGVCPYFLIYQQFSRKTGLSDSTLHRLELGQQNVTLNTMEQICDRLKCSISDIFAGD
jgi:transcriptional regulator with XRE-family HTH domain